MPRYIDVDKAITAINDEMFMNESTKSLFRMILRAIPNADVVPIAEVDKWYHEYHAIKDELKQEKMYHRETEKLADKAFNELQAAKSEVAREIFEEIATSMLMRNISTISLFALDIAKLKKKYTEGNNDR